MRIRLDLAYDGSHYKGWQKQNHTSNTVQGNIESSLSKLFNEEILVQASGRTDQGVHARNQVLHFDTTRDLSKYQLSYSLPLFLPNDIAIKGIYQTPDDFHARYSVVAKEYRYYIYSNPEKNPFFIAYSMHMKRALSLELLNSYAKTILGLHDFSSFRKSGSTVYTTERKIYRASWRKHRDFYEFRVIGNGFLRQMVRSLVGCMLHLEKHGKNSQEMMSILDAKDRGQSGVAVEPNGLFLHKVYYPRKLDNKCLKL